MNGGIVDVVEGATAIIIMLLVATTANNTRTEHYTTIIMNNHLEFSFRMSKADDQED